MAVPIFSATFSPCRAAIHVVYFFSWGSKRWGGARPSTNTCSKAPTRHRGGEVEEKEGKTLQKREQLSVKWRRFPEIIIITTQSTDDEVNCGNNARQKTKLNEASDYFSSALENKAQGRKGETSILTI